MARAGGLGGWVCFYPKVAPGDGGEAPMSEGSVQGVDPHLFTEHRPPL